MDNKKEQTLEERLEEIKPKEKTKDGTEKEAEDLTLRYVAPHKKVSRNVTDSDLKFVMDEAHIMFSLLFTPYKNCLGGYAIAHQQINNVEPLRFFVTKDQEIIINPVITKHTRHTVDSEEGCLTFADMPTKIIQRYNKIEVEYYTLVGTGDLSEKKEISLSGHKAFEYEHELDHFECEYIWNEEQIKKYNEDKEKLNNKQTK